MIIVSLASYNKRLSYLLKTIASIINLTLKFDKLIINIPDDSDELTKAGFVNLKLLDSRIEVHLREAKWRSANKLLWTAREYPNEVIITCDDDIFYPDYFFETQYDVWELNKDCIVAQEISPVYIQNNNILHISAVDLKLGLKCFGRYLTGCCLFPPHCLDNTVAYDFNTYFNVTHATHDELWFWCMTTMKGIKSIGLNCTWSFDSDEVVLPRDENSLSKINSDPYLKDYNQRINDVFGNKLVLILKNQTIEFKLSKDTLLAFTGNIDLVYNVYGQCYHIKLICDKTILKSHLAYLSHNLNKHNWTNGIEVKLNA